LRGIDVHTLMAKVSQQSHDQDLPPLAFGCAEEPVLYPDSEDAELDNELAAPQVAWLQGNVSPRFVDAAVAALSRLGTSPTAQA
jgi:hypothetical protein